MAEATPNTQPNLALQGVYLKDASYEAPQGPRGDGNWQPQINLDLATNSTPIQGDLREVVLTVTVSAKQNDQTLFLVEVKQAGAFLMQHLSEGRHQARHRQHLPGRAVSLRPLDGLAAGLAGRLSAAAAAARELRRAVPERAGAIGTTRFAAQELTHDRDRADRHTRQRLLGHGARDPVRACRQTHPTLGP